LPDEPGHLYKVLEVFKRYDLNLKKIQSVPIPEVTNLYAFHMSISFPDEQLFKKALEELIEMVEHVNILGIYEGANL
jgi:prephenate dehydratase